MASALPLSLVLPAAPYTPTLAGLITKYIFENPWPLALLCLAVGGFLLWKWLREGDRAMRDIGGAAAAAGCVVLVLGYAITTNGERASRVVREFVTRAETGDTSGMLELLTPTCVLHYGAPENPGVPREMWEPAIGLLKGRYTIESNSVTRLDAESAGGDAATVELACVTSVDIAPYPTPSAWWLKVGAQSDGSWKIERIASRKIGGQVPTPGTF
jgi:hypothetical protein